MTSTQPENEDQALQEKLRLSEQIVHLTIQIRQQEERDDQERLLELVQTKGQAWVDLLQSLNVTALHVLSAIGEHEPIKGIQIARQLGITKGAISKVTRKLLEQELIFSERLPNNRKEIYFRLSQKGREIFKWHQQLHPQLEEQGRQFLLRYSIDELQLIVRFCQDYLNQG
ncbi:MarR family transcriptional regulator [Ktedonosporobacter rubrisoli]|uniref:MarR family transcriptional regulator n=1 Tax=Ktedonosporobacter rubrisoli TaxID=2509675 RepID=A0A4V0YY42_KTERU|nr:MarR family transcriptional regulator [Ktedonosporobacter rubrisoli]QBD74911.1 MarR family transcriptional regulator [Ktedonosporobacter rubrisoli]